MLTALRRRAARVRATRDAGVTLMELVVAMTLSTILGAMTLAVFVRVNDSSSSTTDRAISSRSASLVMNAWPSYLKVSDGTTAGSIGNRFEWLTSTDMLFYANLYNRPMGAVDSTTAPTMVWLRLDSSGALVEEQFPSTASAGTNPTVCRVLTDIRRARVTAGDSDSTSPLLFTPYDVGANAMLHYDAASHTVVGYNLGTAPTATAGCRALPVTPPSRAAHPDPVISGNLQNVASVGITFTVRDSRSAHPLDFSAIVTLPIPQPVQIPGT